MLSWHTNWLTCCGEYISFDAYNKMPKSDVSLQIIVRVKTNVFSTAGQPVCVPASDVPAWLGLKARALAWLRQPVAWPGFGSGHGLGLYIYNNYIKYIIIIIIIIYIKMSWWWG